MNYIIVQINKGNKENIFLNIMVYENVCINCNSFIKYLYKFFKLIIYLCMKRVTFINSKVNILLYLY